MSKWLICLLGGVDGLLFAGAARTMGLYLDYLARTIPQESDLDTTGRVYVNLASLQEKWLGATLIIVCMFMLASYAAGLYWRKNLRYHIVGWIVVGIGAVTAWNLFILALGLWDRGSSGQTLIIESITRPGNPLHGPMSLGLVVAVNLVFGMVVGALSGKSKSFE